MTSLKCAEALPPTNTAVLPRPPKTKQVELPFVTFYLLMWFGKEHIAKKNLTFSDFPASDRVQQHLTFVDFSDKTDKYSSYVSRSITMIRFASEKARL